MLLLRKGSGRKMAPHGRRMRGRVLSDIPRKPQRGALGSTQQRALHKPGADYDRALGADLRGKSSNGPTGLIARCSRLLTRQPRSDCVLTGAICARLAELTVFAETWSSARTQCDGSMPVPVKALP
jgi:hypothetical protein